MENIELYNKFCEDACLNKKYSPYVKSRKNGERYAVITITSKGHNFGKDWHTWWEPYIGLSCLARLRFETNRYTKKEFISEAFPVRLMNTKIIEGRCISATSFSLV